METEAQKASATPEEIWKILREVSESHRRLSRRIEETAEQMKETDRQMKETDRRIEETAEQMKETDRQMKETDRRIEETAEQMKETDRRMKETDRRLEKTDALFNTQWGKLMESLVEGDLIPLLGARGILVTETHRRVGGRRNGEHFEFDILAANGTEVVVVEVKTTLKADDVGAFLKKLERFTEWLPRYEGEKILGAVAYLQTDESVQVHAQRQGLYVIRATGSSASIVNPADFQPRVFH